MAALAASALRPLAGRFLLPSCDLAFVSGQRRPPLLKVAKPQTSVHRSVLVCVKKCAAAPNHRHQEFRASDYQFDDDEPLWLAVVRDLAVNLRGLVAFLAEQPRQLKFLEWPGFQNTIMRTLDGHGEHFHLLNCKDVYQLKTASLTLVLVSIFIVALSTIDAALCYIMAWLLRKSA